LKTCKEIVCSFYSRDVKRIGKKPAVRNWFHQAQQKNRNYCRVAKKGKGDQEKRANNIREQSIEKLIKKLVTTGCKKKSHASRKKNYLHNLPRRGILT
jgi:hypothetical protein